MNRFATYSWLITALLLLAGFLCLEVKAVGYGAAFFMAFPWAVGFAIGTLEQSRRNVLYLILGVVIFMALLLSAHLEGMVCVLMALPIFAGCVLLGSWAQRAFRRKHETPNETPPRLLALLTPLAVLLVTGQVEKFVTDPPALVTVTTSVTLPYPAQQVFEGVQQMDTLAAPKPWLLRLGLPTPYKCVLTAPRVGGRRTCLFDNGRIVAEITDYQPGERLTMDVIEYSLTGRHWFHFQDARYTFHRQAHQTVITRTSSYRSQLRPRWYWQPLETYGIAQEHRFVLASLRQNLERERQAAHPPAPTESVKSE
jgi:Ca2+/Na+ antiporter